MFMNYKRRIIQLSCFGNYEEEATIIQVFAPENISNAEVHKRIQQCHDILNDKNNEVSYQTLMTEYSSMVNALMDYVSKENHWTWEYGCDIEIDLFHCLEWDDKENEK